MLVKKLTKCSNLTAGLKFCNFWLFSLAIKKNFISLAQQMFAANSEEILLVLVLTRLGKDEDTH